MTWRIRDRAGFQALAGARRFRRGPLSLRYLPTPTASRARVAYAVGRNAGSAVQRNRIRRRLRAAIGVADGEGRLVPGAYLVGAGPEALSMSFAEVERGLAELLEAARGETR